MDNGEGQAAMIDQDGGEGHEIGRPHMPGYGLLAAEDGARHRDPLEA